MVTLRAGFTRREMLRFTGALAAATFLPSVRGDEVPHLPEKRADLLNELKRRACLYFYQEAHPRTGLVLDRARTEGSDSRRVASIAATGFGLSALCIAHKNGLISTELARERVERTFDFFANRAFHQRGFYFHFLDAESGQRAYQCEVSSIDTTWLLCGVIH